MCKSSAAAIGVQTYSAGELISRARVLDLKDKRVADVDGNQDALVLSVRAIVDATILLDGHFCLLGKDELISHIPIATFEALNPSGLAVVTTDPVVAARRLLERDGRSIGATVLAALQDAELSYARELSKHLNVPLRILGTGRELETFASSILA
jgi:adenylate kinase